MIEIRSPGSALVQLRERIIKINKYFLHMITNLLVKMTGET